MGNLCCTDSTIASSDQASPKFAARANGQVASEPVVAKTTQPRPAFHNNNGTTVVNGSSPNKQNLGPPSNEVSKSNTITIRARSSTSQVTVSSSKINASSSKVNASSKVKIPTSKVDVSSSHVTTNGTTVRSGADKRDSIDNEVENYIENNITIDNEEEGQYSFPPVLEDFNLMDCDIDPTVLEEVFADDK